MQEPFGNAVHACTKVNLRGKRVAIVGCGTIGLFAVAVARGRAHGHPAAELGEGFAVLLGVAIEAGDAAFLGGEIDLPERAALVRGQHQQEVVGSLVRAHRQVL